MTGRGFTVEAIELLNRAARIAEEQNFEAWNEKRQRMEPAVGTLHIIKALRERSKKVGEEHR